MTWTTRSTLPFTVLGFVWSCAATLPATAPEPAPRPEAMLARAATLQARGCYRCLLEAQALYENLLQTAPGAATTGVFQTALLIGLRERELGLLGKGSFERAAELAAAPTAPAWWPIFVAVADASPWQTVGLPKAFLDEAAAARRDSFQDRDNWNAVLQPLVPSNPVAAYLYLSLNCRRRGWSEQPPELAEVLTSHDDTLFVRYRQARCGGGLVELSSIQTLEPRFTEMEYFLGRRARRDRDHALAGIHFQAAYQDWPDWPAPTLALGDLAFAAEDFQGSLRYYDEMLALVTDQRDALLGKAIALSYLERNSEALPLLDRLVELGQWYLGDAYFWRAWNRFVLASIEPAREDIEQSKNYRSAAEVFTLSGQIALEQRRLQDARRELETALERNGAYCDAAFHLGRVHIEEARWPDTGQAFGHAAQCYVDEGEELAANLWRLRRDPAVPEDRRARLLPRHEARLATAHRQAASSAYNAALGYVNAQMLDDATTFAEQASSHPDFTERATALLGRIRARP